MFKGKDQTISAYVTLATAKVNTATAHTNTHTHTERKGKKLTEPEIVSVFKI